MKRRIEIAVLVFLIWLLFLVVSVQADELKKPARACLAEISTGVGGIFGAGTGENPGALVEALAAVRCGRFTVEGGFGAAFASKIETGHGVALRGSGTVRIRLAGPFFAVAAMLPSHFDAGAFRKGVIQVGAGGGVEFGRDDLRHFVEVLALLPETQTPNRITGAVVEFREDWLPARRRWGLRFRVRVPILRFSAVGANETPLPGSRRTGARLALTLHAIWRPHGK